MITPSTHPLRERLAAELAKHDPWTIGGNTWECRPCGIEEPVPNDIAGDALTYAHWAEAQLPAVAAWLLVDADRLDAERQRDKDRYDGGDLRYRADLAMQALAIRRLADSLSPEETPNG